MCIKLTKYNLWKATNVFILILVFSLFASSCSSPKEEVSALPKLSETNLYELKIPEHTVVSWGIAKAYNLDFYIKQYSDPNRKDISAEVTGSIPDYCLPLASLLLDSKKSGAEMLSFQSFTTKDGINYLELRMSVYPSPELARKQFLSVLSVKDKCRSLIKKDNSGDSPTDWVLWDQSPVSSPNSISWESDGDLSQSWGIGVSGGVIYQLRVILKSDLPKAIELRSKAKEYVLDALKNMGQN